MQKKYLGVVFFLFSISAFAVEGDLYNRQQHSHKQSAAQKSIIKPASKESIQFAQAFQSGNFEMMDILLGQGADINCGNCIPSLFHVYTGLTPLMSGMENRVETGSAISKYVRYLVEKGANLNIQDKTGKTALMYGADNGFNPFWSSGYQVIYLLESGANPSLKDKDGNNLLHYAFNKGYSLNLPTEDVVKQAKNVVRLSVERGLNINQQNVLGETPLHFAAAKCLNDGIEYLIMMGANPSIKTKAGVTALNIATEKATNANHQEICNETVHILQSSKQALTIPNNLQDNTFNAGSSASNKQAIARFSGTYAGTYIGSNTGTFEVTILGDGMITFNGYSSRGEPFSGEGKLNNDGSVAIASDSTGSTFVGSINQDIFEGTWKNIKYNQAGSFQGKKGAEFVKTQPTEISPVAGFFGVLNKILTPPH
jgi:hypothetical protein